MSCFFGVSGFLGEQTSQNQEWKNQRQHPRKRHPLIVAMRRKALCFSDLRQTAFSVTGVVRCLERSDDPPFPFINSAMIPHAYRRVSSANPETWFNNLPNCLENPAGAGLRKTAIASVVLNLYNVVPYASPMVRKNVMPPAPHCRCIAESPGAWHADASFSGQDSGKEKCGRDSK